VTKNIVPFPYTKASTKLSLLHQINAFFLYPVVAIRIATGTITTIIVRTLTLMAIPRLMVGLLMISEGLFGAFNINRS
jgi:hypothetical protein